MTPFADGERSVSPDHRGECGTHTINSGKGVVVGYFLDVGGSMVKRPPADIQRLALEQSARVHPQHTTEFDEFLDAGRIRLRP
jgi:hypothetical protein